MTVAELTATLPAEAWVRHRVCEGSKGPPEYEFARIRIVEKQHHQPAWGGWMLARRPVEPTQGRVPKTKYYLSNAP